jgi:hypothetical protein
MSLMVVCWLLSPMFLVSSTEKVERVTRMSLVQMGKPGQMHHVECPILKGPAPVHHAGHNSETRDPWGGSDLA